jgi:hypothetical protein
VVLLGVAARALRGYARRYVIGRGGGLRDGERFGRCRWAAAGLGRGVADQEREVRADGSVGMGACRMLQRSHDQLLVSWLWSAGRMGCSHAARASCALARDGRTGLDVRAMRLSNEYNGMSVGNGLHWAI